jgi:hypothetical protein
MNKHIAFRIVELAMNKAKSHEEMKFYVMAILEGYKMALKELNEIAPEQETTSENEQYPEVDTENDKKDEKSEIIELIKKYSKKSKYNDCTTKQRQAIYKALGRRKIKLTNELKEQIRNLDRKLASKLLDKLYNTEEDDEE